MRIDGGTLTKTAPMIRLRSEVFEKSAHEATADPLAVFGGGADVGNRFDRGGGDTLSLVDGARR